MLDLVILFSPQRLYKGVCREREKGRQRKKENFTRKETRWLVSMFLRLVKHDCLKEWLERPWGRGRSKRKFSSEMLHARAWTIPLTPSMFRKSIKPIICLERWAWRDELSWESLWWHEMDSRSLRLRIECTCLHEQLYILHNDECRVAPRIFHTPTNPPRSPGPLYCFVLLLDGRRRRQWWGLDDIRGLRWRERDKIWESRFWWGEGVSVVAGRCREM